MTDEQFALADRDRYGAALQALAKIDNAPIVIFTYAPEEGRALVDPQHPTLPAPYAELKHLIGKKVKLIKV